MSRFRPQILATALLAAVPLMACGSTAAKPAPIDPAQFTGRVDNPWYPLIPGSGWRYRGTKDGKRAVDVVTVTHAIKKILGVPNVVVKDRLYLDGTLEETTTDWYTQSRKGDVWYFGEKTAELDAQGNVTSREGSWQAGVDGAQPGIYMPAHPAVGETFRQEYYRGHAEDHFTVVDLAATVKAPYVTSHRALRTTERTPLEPGVLDSKLYVRGIGTALEAQLKGPGHERLELVSFHH